MPCDISRFVPHEITHVQGVPQIFVRLKRHGIKIECFKRFAFAHLYQRMRIVGLATQHCRAGPVQVFQQLAFPCIPYLGAGATDIGHRQQIQSAQIPFVAHLVGECTNDIGIAQILFLRHMAHGQVVLDEKFNQLLIGFGNAVLATKQPHFFGAQIRMVAAASFRNVVKQSGHIQNPGLLPTGCELRAKRVFMRMLDDEKPPHIAQHHQDVLVHGVDMKQIMLHLPHDAPKNPQVPTQYRGLVHQPHGMCDALGRLQNAHEHGAVGRVAPKGCIHQATGVVKRSQGARRQTFDADGFLVDPKCFQNGMGLALVQTVIDDFQHARFV